MRELGSWRVLIGKNKSGNVEGPSDATFWARKKSYCWVLGVSVILWRGVARRLTIIVLVHPLAGIKGMRGMLPFYCFAKHASCIQSRRLHPQLLPGLRYGVEKLYVRARHRWAGD